MYDEFNKIQKIESDFDKERLKDTEGKKALHPTQKPEELLKRIILGFSNENDVILDPFAGSGTTPYIAKKYNRNFIAIEKEEKYVKAIEKRVAIKHKKQEKQTLPTVNQN